VRTLGLDRLAALCAAETAPGAVSEIPLQLDLAAAPTHRTVLDAHQALADLSETNRTTFRDVIDCLKTDSR
jgi:hypothetical protein